MSEPLVRFAGDELELFDREKARFPRDRAVAVEGPLNFWIEKYGQGTRAVIADRDHENIDSLGTSAVEYHVHWTETVETNTAAGIAAGFARTILLAPAIPAPGRKGAIATAIYADPKYVTGFFFCTGVSATGERSAPVGPVQITSGTAAGVPSDAEHFQASESGEQDGQGVLSKISYSFEAPDVIANLARFQFYFRHYPVLNQVSEGESIQRSTGAGGSQTGDIRLPIARRVGVGTISIAGTAVTGVGTNFLALAAATGGDALEVFGVRAIIDSVASPTSMTLSAAWTGAAVSGEGTWLVIGSVTIYLVSVGYDGSRRDDYENAPSVTLLLDGELSAPNAPTLAVFTIPQTIRVEVTPSSGTQIAEVRIRRGTGAGEAFADCALVHVFKADQINGSSPLVWDDSNFTVLEKENGQVFSYYATAVNVRDQESAASARAEASCKLSAGQDVDPSVAGRVGLKQLLFNSFISGVDTVVVASSDVNQDQHFDVTAGVNEPGQPYGGVAVGPGFGRFRGYTRWHGAKTAGATFPSHTLGNAVKMPAPGSGEVCYLYQELDAWDSTNAPISRFNKVKKDGIYVLSVYLKHGGTQPNGTFAMYAEQYNDNTLTAQCPMRYRDSSGDLAWSTGTLGDIVGSLLLASWQRFYITLMLDSSLGTTKQVRINFAHGDSTAGDVYVCQPMFNEGEEAGLWLADMSDPNIGWPVPSDPPSGIGDGPGSRRGYILEP